jgi:hypothetical protein
VDNLNFKYPSAGKGATVTARFGEDGITIIDPQSNDARMIFQRISDQPIRANPSPPKKFSSDIWA